MSSSAPKTRTTSTRRLSEVARHVVIPSGATKTDWPKVEGALRALGVSFDRWQVDAAKVALARRGVDGPYAAGVGGVVLSIPRQVGKTFWLGALVFALCLIHPGSLVVWTAHLKPTAQQTFRDMQAFALRRKVAPFISKVYTADGEESIIFKNGSRVMFGARGLGFGRGFKKVKLLVFDEAQKLAMKTMDDMVPATNQADNPLVFLAGTPPRPVIDQGEVFTARRQGALSGEDEDTFYLEFSADPDANPDDRKQWAKANPSYPHRTPDTAILRMKKLLPDVDSFAREALGIWDDDNAGGTGAIDASKWREHKGTLTATVGPVVLGVDTSLDRKLSALIAVGGTSEEVAQVRVVRAEAGSMWVPEMVVRVCREHPEVEAIVIDDKKSTEPLAKEITEALEDAGLQVEIVRTSYADMAEACADTFDLIHEGTLVHAGDPELDAAVRSAVKKDIEGSFTWSRLKAGAAVVPLVAMTLALWEWRRRMASDYDVMDSVL